MRFKDALRLSVFVVVAMLHTCLGQSCTSDLDCHATTKCCNTVTQQCTAIAVVATGLPATVDCQCETNKLDESSTPSCACEEHDDCPSKCCDSTKGICKAKSVVEERNPASVYCECKTDNLDSSTGLCTCEDNDECSTECCDTTNGICKPKNDILEGEKADVSCQCITGQIDGATQLCLCRLGKDCASGCCNTVKGECTPNGVLAAGAAADVDCQCESNDRTNAGICDCKNNNHCFTDCCNTVTNQCIPEKTVQAGAAADFDCQCESGEKNNNGLCVCTDDDHCDTTCCDTGTKECIPETTVAAGSAADFACECKSRERNENGICVCTDDDHCDTTCCDTGTKECIPEKTVAAGSAADFPCECESSQRNENGICECVSNDECQGDEICCPEDHMCGERGIQNPEACGDPHMTGFLGQKFDFTGKDGGWYVLVSDPLSMHLNMRVSAPIPSLPEITYITGLSLLTTDADGVDHTVVISVKTPHSMDSACPEGINPCLADGSLNVVADGNEVLMAPGTVTLGAGVQVTAVNIPGECRSFGFETYWERKKEEHAQSGRRLKRETTLSIGEWILADPTATNMAECTAYVIRAMSEEGAIFAHQSEHASFQIVTPTETIRLSHGRLHQLPMRDPTDRFDLPDHLTWQMNMAIDHTDISDDAQGILGETLVPTVDESGNAVMHGMECIRGEEADYSVAGPLGTIFTQGEHGF